MTYKPLPDCVEIRISKIHGMGLFAKELIESNHFIGMSHVHLESGELIRTPLGGFYNHSDKKYNCIKAKRGMFYHLRALRDIEPGEELTVNYNFYKIGDSD